MQIDTGMLAIFVTVLITIIGLSASLGALSQKVKNHGEQISSDRKDNRDDHQQMFNKLDEINNYMRNGHPK